MGYPITSETALSITKTAKLLQTLVDLAKGKGEGGSGEELPEGIQKCVDNVLVAQKKLVKQIDEYLHSTDREVDEFQVVSSIIETCPEFLATKNNDNVESLPIRRFACSDNEEVVTKYVPLLAEVGRKYGIGGEESRGGLLVKNANGDNALEAVSCQKSSNVMKALKNADPPLLLKEDVRDYTLLHNAVANGSIEMVKYMIELDPSCLCYDDDEFGIPLLEVCLYEDEDGDETDNEQKKTRLKIAEYLIREAATYSASNNTIGGLFYKSKRGTLIIQKMVQKYGTDDTWSCIKQALSSFPNIPILHEVIRHSPQNIGSAISQFPDSVLIRDSQNRLPIHVAFQCGVKWGADLVLMMHVNRDHLKDVDPVTKRPPFVLAALDETEPCDLSTVYYLLRGHPEHVEVFLNGRKRKKKNSPNAKNTNVNNSPKRKKTKYHLRQRHYN